MRETSREEDGMCSCKQVSESRKMSRVDKKRQDYEEKLAAWSSLL